MLFYCHVAAIAVLLVIVVVQWLEYIEESAKTQATVVAQQQQLETRVQARLNTLGHFARLSHKAVWALSENAPGPRSAFDIVQPLLPVEQGRLLSLVKDGRWYNSPWLNQDQGKALQRLVARVSPQQPMAWSLDRYGDSLAILFNSAWLAADGETIQVMQFNLGNLAEDLYGDDVLLWRGTDDTTLKLEHGLVSTYPLGQDVLPLAVDEDAKLVSLRGEHRYRMSEVALPGNEKPFLLLHRIDDLEEPVFEEIEEGIWKAVFLFLIWLAAERGIQGYFALKNMGYRDGLTGLYNRRGLERSLSELSALHDRHRLSDVGAIMIDIDHFKSFNDQYGHGAGDQALVALAQVLQTSCRRSDLLFRLGGEEFLVICPGEDETTLALVAEKLRREVKKLKHGGELPRGLTISAGIALRQHGEGSEDFLARADRRLYRAKECGRDLVVCN